MSANRKAGPEWARPAAPAATPGAGPLDGRTRDQRRLDSPIPIGERQALLNTQTLEEAELEELTERLERHGPANAGFVHGDARVLAKRILERRAR